MKKYKDEYREYKKELKRFDPILKEIFSKAAGKLISIATGEKINQELEDITSEIEFVKSLRPDMVFRAGEKIFHIEIQVQPDKDLPERMLLYSLAIKEKFGQKPVQIVLFAGKGNPPPSLFRDEFTIHKFIVLDMKKIDPDEFIKSKKPEEVIVGILAGKFKEKSQIIERVKERIVEIVKNEEEIAKYIDSISFLAGLFDVKIEVKPMPIQVDIRKTFLYKWGKEEGLKEGEQRGIERGLKEGEKRGIEKGKQEGLKEGLKKAILVDIEEKFGISKARQIKKLLVKINEINRLEKIKKEVIRAKTWEDFIKVFKNPNSKNKNSKAK
jgi:predicted transposase YdaD